MHFACVHDVCAARVRRGARACCVNGVLVVCVLCAVVRARGAFSLGGRVFVFMHAHPLLGHLAVTLRPEVLA